MCKTDVTLLQLLVWMLLDSVLCGQLEGCETPLSQLQFFAGSLQAAVTSQHSRQQPLHIDPKSTHL